MHGILTVTEGTMKVLNDIINDAKEYCAGVFLELFKTYDTVDHCVFVTEVGIVEGSFLGVSECCYLCQLSTADILSRRGLCAVTTRTPVANRK